MMKNIYGIEMYEAYFALSGLEKYDIDFICPCARAFEGRSSRAESCTNI
jgi:hypothetical protein